MDDLNFDRLTRLLSERGSRRGASQTTAIALAGLLSLPGADLLAKGSGSTLSS